MSNTNTDKKKEFINKVKKEISPEIIKLGFTRKNLSFRKEAIDKIFFITFQFGRSSLTGKVILELGILNLSKLLDWEKCLPIQNLNYDSAQERQRIGSIKKGEDGIWFDYENDDIEEIIKKINELLDKELPLFFNNK